MDPKEILPIIERLEENRIPYALGGSGLLYYLNLMNNANDWDITVDCSKDKLIKAIGGYEWEERKTGDFPFASKYRLNVASLKIDFIGYFAIHAEEKVVKLPVRRYRKWENIHLSSPEIWYVAYDLMGRKEKADLILNYLNTNKEVANTEVIHDLIKQLGQTNKLAQELKKLIL